MNKNLIGRVTAVLFFLLLLIGASFCLIRLIEDIRMGNYFNQPDELQYEVIFLASYILIILLSLRYGFYLAINRVNWKIVKDDFLFILNRKYFSQIQWIFNILLFWLALVGFIFSLTISAMKGNL